MRRLPLALLLAAALAGCSVPPVKVGPGDTVVNGRLALAIDSAWNHFPAIDRPWTLWTADGVAIDELRFWAGVKEGQPLAPPERDRRPLAFRSTMQAHELVALFGSLHTREGCTFTLDRMEPADFVGVPGVRFRYSLLRYYDDVRLSGVGF